ncbi:MAG: hypothetical protein ABDK94_04395 [Atribacterota bacterium]
MIFSRLDRSSFGFTLLETIITVGIISFLTFVIYAIIVSLGFRMRLELTGSPAYLLPESKSQVNQQVVVNQVNRFFAEVAREIRNAAMVQVEGESVLTIVQDGASSMVYGSKEFSAGGRTMKAIVCSANGQERIMVQGISTFTVSQSSDLIHIAITVEVGGKVQDFKTSVLQRNPNPSS